MPDNERIEDLRRRIQKDPASIAFAQLAEEHRRAGQIQEAIDVCRAGLAVHPGYLSARVTLGRALIEIDRLDDAQSELELVRKSAPENLAALRALAEIHGRRGALQEASDYYPTTLTNPMSVPSAAAVAGVGTPAQRTLQALEHFLTAIHVARTDRRA